MKLQILILILVISYSVCGQVFAPKLEEFSLEAPLVFSGPLQSPAFVMVSRLPATGIYRPSNNRRYVAFQKGTYFFILSDPTEYPEQIKMAQKFAKSEKAAGIEQKIDKYIGKKYEFATSDGYYHRILIIKVNDHEYVFQTTGETKDDALAERFFADIRLGKSKSTPQPPGNSTTPIVNADVNSNIVKSNGTSGANSNPPNRTAPTTPLKITFQLPADYNEFGRFYSVTGIVRLRVMFEPNGKIGSVEPVIKLPFALTDQAIEAAKQIKFDPETINGVPQQAIKIIDYSFSIL